MKTISRLALLAGCMAISACSVMDVKYPQKVKEELPVDMPVRAITGFTPGLQCMDTMFIRYQVKPIRITASQIPDFSESRGDAGYGAREMLISAISNMSQKSGALRFVAYDRSTPDIIALQSAHPEKDEFKVPDFFIRGAVTQIDQSPYSKQKGLSVSASDLDFKEIQSTQLSDSNSATLKTVAVDLNIGLINTFELLPGIYSSNSLAVERRNSSDDLSLSIWKLGAVYTLSESKARALSSGLRALMEVGAIELFGKLYNLPYWECLATLGPDSELTAESRKLYDAMGETTRMMWLAEQLKHKKLLAADAEVTVAGGGMSDAFREALGQYRAHEDMFGSSQLTFEVFDSMYRDKHYEEMASKPTPDNATHQGVLPQRAEQAAPVQGVEQGEVPPTSAPLSDNEGPSAKQPLENGKSAPLNTGSEAH